MQNNTGNIIRQKRKERGLTLNTLANKLNISASNLSRIETGALKVSANLINQLVEIFKVSPQYFSINHLLTLQMPQPKTLSYKILGYQLNTLIYSIKISL